MNNHQFDQAILNKTFYRAAWGILAFVLFGWGISLTPLSTVIGFSSIVSIVKHSTVDLVLLFVLLMVLFRYQKKQFLSNAGTKAIDIEQEMNQGGENK